MSARYWAQPEQWPPDDSGVVLTSLEQMVSSNCLLITDDEGLWARGVARSHANLVDGEEAERLWVAYEGCVFWLRDLEDLRWTSLSVRDRTKRLEFLWDWERVGATQLPGGRHAEVWRWVR